MIKIERKRENSDKRRNYKIFIDNKYYDEIRNGEIKEINNIGNGNHEIYIRVGYCRSNIITVNEKEDDIIELQCGNMVNAIERLFLSMYVSLSKKANLFIKFKQ